MKISLHQQYRNLIERFSIIEDHAKEQLYPLYKDQMIVNVKKLIIPHQILEILNNYMFVESKMPLENYVRYHRDILLKQSDWSQVPDSTVDKASWAVYRQELRDMSAQLEFPDNVTWPVSPDDK